MVQFMMSEADSALSSELSSNTAPGPQLSANELLASELSGLYTASEHDPLTHHQEQKQKLNPDDEALEVVKAALHCTALHCPALHCVALHRQNQSVVA